MSRMRRGKRCRRQVNVKAENVEIRGAFRNLITVVLRLEVDAHVKALDCPRISMENAPKSQ